MKISKLAITSALAASVCGAAFAAPQTTFDKGEVQLDAGWYAPKAEVNVNDNTLSNDTKDNFTGGITYGLSDRLGLQYNYTGLKTDANTERGNTTGNSQEANLIYSLNKNIAMYGGYNRIDTGSDTINNVAQAGIIAKAPITDRLSLYGKAGVGTKKTTTWEAGLGYNVTKDLDVNAGYKYLNTQNGDSDDHNVSYKGWTAGLSYRFGGDSESEDYTPVATPVEPVETTPAYVPVQPTAPAEAPKADYYFESIHFATDDATPLPNQQDNLVKLVQLAKSYPNNTIKLVGNTDSQGSAEYNENLSRERVTNVYNYAVNNGVPASQLVTMYRGENDPSATNDTEQGRADNRRVDVYLNK